MVFLVDTGADNTVVCASDLVALGLEPYPAPFRLAGVGGTSEALVIQTEIRMLKEDGGDVSFPGEFSALIDDETLDISVLGRDVTQFFTLIIDRPGDAVWMIGQRHSYRIEQR